MSVWARRPSRSASNQFLFLISFKHDITFCYSLQCSAVVFCKSVSSDHKSRWENFVATFFVDIMLGRRMNPLPRLFVVRLEPCRVLTSAPPRGAIGNSPKGWHRRKIPATELCDIMVRRNNVMDNGKFRKVLSWASPRSDAFRRCSVDVRNVLGLPMDVRSRLNNQALRHARFAILNIKTLNGRKREIPAVLKQGRIDVCALKESRWRVAKSTDMGDEHKIIYQESSQTSKGVAVAVSNRFHNSVLEVGRCSAPDKDFASDRCSESPLLFGVIIAERMFVGNENIF